MFTLDDLKEDIYTAVHENPPVEGDLEGFDYDSDIGEFWYSPDYYTLPNLGKPEVVEEWGGEGEGDSKGVIFKVQDRLFRKEGFYDSWNGTDWSEGDPLQEVEEYEETVKRYRPFDKS